MVHWELGPQQMNFGVGQGEGHSSVHNNLTSMAWLSHSSLPPLWPPVCNFSVVLSISLPVNARVPQNSVVWLLLFPTNPNTHSLSNLTYMHGFHYHIQARWCQSVSQAQTLLAPIWMPNYLLAVFYETQKCQTPKTKHLPISLVLLLDFLTHQPNEKSWAIFDPFFSIHCTIHENRMTSPTVPCISKSYYSTWFKAGVH